MRQYKCLTVKALNKSNVWDIQENDIFRMLGAAVKDADFEDNFHRYTDIIKTAFDIEEVKIVKPVVIGKYEARGFKVGDVKLSESRQVKWAVKKRPIMRVNDLTYENIHHITAAHLMEVIERNFGGGWDSLPQSIQDIITSGFDISTTTLPKEKLHKAGGMYEKKIDDGFKVLEIPKGTWVEAIFAKEKPKVEKMKLNIDKPDFDDEDGDESLDANVEYDTADDEEDGFDDEKLTEESYRTTFETSPDDLSLENADMTDEEEENY